ncbi:rho GDP-dissociation inhibitor 1-like [Styela clava]|uniref:rho GDP-dissociation inhibitor 1-like n=1 Tax=Styela clava TaxID=7725 RepID=UPI001939EE60|nr:rho GDP-dissociation inhibitor 1-like [Styela clava]
MAECQKDEDEITPGYKAPAQKSLQEIANQDADDESLRRYKESLLGNIGDIKKDPNDTRNIILQSLSVVVEGRDDISLDLTGDLSKFKDSPITMKEGTTYRLKMSFKITSEIVSGLQLLTTIHRKGIKVDTQRNMVGSYGPKADVQHYTGKPEDAPSGMIARGKYTCKSKFIDDDKNVILEWQWILDIKKDWN